MTALATTDGLPLTFGAGVAIDLPGAVPTDWSIPEVLRDLQKADALYGDAVVTAQRSAFAQPILNTGTQKWAGVVPAAGLLFCIPYDATAVLILDPAHGHAWQTDFGLSGMSDLAKWSGAALGSDGLIRCAPYNATDILTIDPVAMTAFRSALGATLTGSAKYDGAVVGGDGKVYCVPRNAASVLVIDPGTGTASTTTYGLSLTGSSKWRGAARVGDKVYCAPYDATDILVIDTAAQTASRSAMTADLTGSTKWGSAAAVGTKVYCVPRSATDILVIDTAAGTASRSALGADLTGSEKWFAAVAYEDKVIGIPGSATDFLVIDDTAGTASRSNLGIYNIRTPNVSGVSSGNKWFAAGLDPTTGKVYAPPGGSTTPALDILTLDPAAMTALHSDFRILVDMSTKWFGGAQAGDGLYYCAPATNSVVLIIDTNRRTAYTRDYGLTFPLGPTSPQKWASGIWANGRIYFITRSTTNKVVVLDLATQTATEKDWGLDLGAAVIDEQKWIGSSLGADGKIYCIPYARADVLIIDPATDTAILSTLGVDMGTPGAASAKWVGGQLHPNGKIYCAPRRANKVLVIDSDPTSAGYQTAELKDWGLDLSLGGANEKWSMPKLGLDGKIYCTPRSDGACVLVIDPATDTAEMKTYGLDYTGYGGSIATCTGPDGKLYALPVSAGDILVLDVITQTASWQTYGLATNPWASPAANKWAGAFQGADGAIYGVPRNAESIILDFAGASPIPGRTRLGPYMNKL